MAAGLFLLFVFALAIIVGLVLFIREQKKYKYLIYIHKLHGNVPIPDRIEKAKLVRVQGIKEGYRVYFKTKSGEEIAANDSYSSYYVSHKGVKVKVFPVFTPDDKQYYPMKTYTIEDAGKITAAGYVPDFTKNSDVISQAIATIRHARMMSTKGWSKFLEIAVPIGMVIILVVGATYMFMYAADYSKSLKAAMEIQANSTIKIADAVEKLVDVTKEVVNVKTGKVPIS